MQEKMTGCQRRKAAFLSREESLDELELLELMLDFAMPRGDVEGTAKRLLERFESFDRVLDAPTRELCKVEGMTGSSALCLGLLGDVMGRYQVRRSNAREYITDHRRAAEYLRPYFFGARTEKVYLLCMNKRGRVIHLARLGEGSLNTAAVDPRQLVTVAMNHGACSVVLAHNHPNGDALPSRSDISTTHHLLRALEPLEIRLLDHLVFADGECLSILHDEEEIRRRSTAMRMHW